MLTERDVSGQAEQMNSYRDVAARTTLSIRSVQRLVKSGQLVAVRFGRRVVVPESELLRLIEQGTKHP